MEEDLFHTRNAHRIANWSDSEIYFAKKVYENDIDYVRNNWMNINESIRQSMIIISAMTNGIDSESVLMFLNEKWQICKDYTCLCAACKYNDKIEVVKYLIEVIGMDPYFRISFGGANCLILASMSNKNEEIIKYLASKVNPNMTDAYGETCLIHIFERFDMSNEIKMHMLEMKELKLNKITIKRCLLESCTHGNDCEIIKYLFEKLDNLSDDDQLAMTKYKNMMLLESAKRNKNLHIIKYLIEHYHADPNYLDNRGDNCLTSCCWKNDNLEIIKYFINDLKMDISHCDIYNNNCFLAACMGNLNLDIIKYLVTETKVDINKINNNNHNGLSFIIGLKQNINIITFLINEANIDIDIERLKNTMAIVEILSIIDDYDKINRMIEKTKESLKLDEFYHAMKRYNFNPFILTENNKIMLGIDPFDIYDYKKCVELINGLKKPVNVPKIDRHMPLIEDLDQFNNTNILDEINLSEVVFKNNGSIYYGNRRKVFNAMHLFNDMNDMIQHDEIVELEGKISENTMNEYINSCHVGKIRLGLVKRDEFINFIKFIDQYPTRFVSIDLIEDQIIEYIDNNKIVYCHYLENICNKYKLKRMYLDIHNNKIESR
jgi:hypothetical protein